MDFSNDEMRLQLVFKYGVKFGTNKSQQVQKSVEEKVVQPKLKLGLPENFKYDFKSEIAALNLDFVKNRLNPNPRKFELPEFFLKKHEPLNLMGDIVNISVILSNADQYIDKTVKVAGWAKTTRTAENDSIVFIELNDGSMKNNLQIVVGKEMPNFKEVLTAQTAYSFVFRGKLIKSLGKNQLVEMQVNDPKEHLAIIAGSYTEDKEKYPLSKKGHSLEYLREIAHLRPRSNLIGCIARIRSNLAFATHQFFSNNGFLYIHTPIITASDCEGAGEMFQITTVIPESGKLDEIKSITDKDTKKRSIDYNKDFFKKPAYLTVSGQLSVETFACALSNVYTFGPTFRAENSNTTRHLAEFWMIEPELSFGDLFDVMDLAESYVKFSISYILTNNKADLVALSEMPNIKKDLLPYLESLIKEPFGKCSYTDAIKILKKAVELGVVFENEPVWGEELYTEHERFLAETVFKKPVIVFNYPKKFKSFYMRLNDDNETVASMDLLAPGVGELIGGSQREERLKVLEDRITECGLKPSNYKWYADLRRYGTVPHGGFGLGFERLVMISTGIDNIRESIPFPRYPGSAEY